MTLFDKCEICGKNLMYATSENEYKKLNCYFCGKEFLANTFCIDGHYICDQCHSENPNKIIEDVCTSTSIKNPFKLADNIMSHPNFNMYGPEHHVLTPAVILTVLKNNNILKQDGSLITNDDIREGIKRASKIPGGWCGFYGSCGSGMGAGVAISVYLGATPAKDKERSYANKMTSNALDKIADNLEHCCKRSVKLSLTEALKFLERNFGIKLEYYPDPCKFSEENIKCEKNACPIFEC
jgi:hypothetical protein